MLYKGQQIKECHHLFLSRQFCCKRASSIDRVVSLVHHCHPFHKRRREKATIRKPHDAKEPLYELSHVSSGNGSHVIVYVGCIRGSLILSIG